MLLLLLPLRALRLAAPEASAEQQDQEHPEGSGHCGSPQTGFTFRELESLPPGLLARASKLNVQQLLAKGRSQPPPTPARSQPELLGEKEDTPPPAPFPGPRPTDVPAQALKGSSVKEAFCYIQPRSFTARKDWLHLLAELQDKGSH